jgi:NAD(P)-dependent dehydrogenase (short-subunit alcohol dehydrogenase family)
VNLELEGRAFLVAGSTRGIGLAIAGALLDEGARVAISGRDGAALEAARDALLVQRRHRPRAGRLAARRR